MTTEAVEYVLGVVETILEGIQVTNIDDYISKAQALMQLIMNANFSGMTDVAQTELDEALMCKWSDNEVIL